MGVVAKKIFFSTLFLIFSLHYEFVVVQAHTLTTSFLSLLIFGCCLLLQQKQKTELFVAFAADTQQNYTAFFCECFEFWIFCIYLITYKIFVGEHKKSREGRKKAINTGHKISVSQGTPCSYFFLILIVSLPII